MAKSIRKRMARADRERLMLDVAEKMFANRGFHDSSMDDVAAAAGITKPMLYNYFGSKEGLLVAGIRRVRHELMERTLRSVSGAPGTEEMFRRAIRAFFEFIDDHGQAWAILRHEGGLTGRAADELEAIRGQQVDFMVATFAAHTDQSVTTLRDLEAIAQLVLGACERLSIWRERSEVSAEDATRYVMTLFWPGLAPYVAR
jgi:AcrR family transcriptional regulator